MTINSLYYKISRNKNISSIILLLSCIFISLILSKFSFVNLFRTTNEFSNSTKTHFLEGLETSGNKYIDDISEKLSKIDDIIKDKCKDKKNDYIYSDFLKKEKITDLVSKMKDSKVYSYKSDLEKILKDKVSDDSDILNKIMAKKVTEIQKEIEKESKK